MRQKESVPPSGNKRKTLAPEQNETGRMRPVQIDGLACSNRAVDRRGYARLTPAINILTQEFGGNYNPKWRTDINVLKKDVETAIDNIKDRSNSEGAAKIHVLRGLKAISRNEEGFEDFMGWLGREEGKYAALARTYVRLDVGVDTEFKDVLGACRDKEADVGGTSELLRLFSNDTEDLGVDVFSGREYSTKGELERIRIENWLGGILVELDIKRGLVSGANELLAEQHSHLKTISLLETELAGAKALVKEQVARVGAAELEIVQVKNAATAMKDWLPEFEVGKLKNKITALEAERNRLSNELGAMKKKVAAVERKNEAFKAAAQPQQVKIESEMPPKAKEPTQTQPLDEDDLEEAEEPPVTSQPPPPPSTTRPRDREESWLLTPLGLGLPKPVRKFGRGVAAIVGYGLLGIGNEMVKPEDPEANAEAVLPSTAAPQNGKNGTLLRAAPAAPEVPTELRDAYDATIREYGRGYNRAARWLRSKVGYRVRAGHRAEATGEFLAESARKSDFRVGRILKLTAMGAAGTVLLAGAAMGIHLFGDRMVQKSKGSGGQRVAEEFQKSVPALQDSGAMQEETKPDSGAGPALLLSKRIPLKDAYSAVGVNAKTNLVRKVDPELQASEDTAAKFIVVEALSNPANMKKYDKKYSGVNLIGIYAGWLGIAADYANMDGQSGSERYKAKVVLGRITEKLEKLSGMKKYRDKIDSKEVSDAVKQAEELAGELPDTDPSQGEKVVVPVVSEAQVDGETTNGAYQVDTDTVAPTEPEAPILVVAQRPKEKPINLDDEISEAVPCDFLNLDTKELLRKFSIVAQKEEDVRKKYLYYAHLVRELSENNWKNKMQERFVFYACFHGMHASRKFAGENKRTIAEVEAALGTFKTANKEVKDISRRKKVEGEISTNTKKSLKWLRNQYKSAKNKLNGRKSLQGWAEPLPGSPAVDNENGAASATPKAVKINRLNKNLVFTLSVYNELGITYSGKHPLDIYKELSHTKATSFQKFVVLKDISNRIINNPQFTADRDLEEKQEMLKILIAYLKSARRAAGEPKYHKAPYKSASEIMSASIDIGELLSNRILAPKAREERRKRRKRGGQETTELPPHLKKIGLTDAILRNLVDEVGKNGQWTKALHRFIR